MRARPVPLCYCFLALLAILAHSSNGFGQSYSWNNSTGNFSDPTQWVGGVAPSPCDLSTALTFGGGSTYTATNDLAPAFYLNSLSLVGSGAPTIGGTSQLRFLGGGTISQSGSGAAVVSAPIALTSGTLSVSVSAGAGQLTLGGTGAGPAIRGNGTLTINNASSNPVLLGRLTQPFPVQAFSGTINVTAGAVKMMTLSSNYLDPAISVNLAAGTTFDFSGYGGGAALGGLGGSGSVNLGAGSLWLHDRTNRSFSGAITGSTFGEIITAGPGTWSFGGSSDITSGSVKVYGGKLRLVDSGTMNALTYTNNPSYYVDGGGTLTLDNTGTMNLNNRLAGDLSGVNLQLGAGSFELIGRNGTASSQVFAFGSYQGGLHLTGGAGKVVVTAGTGGTASVQFGGTYSTGSNAITRFNGGTVVLPAATASASVVLAFGTTTLSNGIVGGFATVGNDWATVNGSNQVIPYSAYTTNATSDSWAATNNVRISSAVSPRTTTGAVNSLNFTSAQTLTLNSGVVLTLNSGGILASASGGITGGSVTAGNVERDLIAIVGSGADFNLASPIINNPGGGNGVTLTKSGLGTLTLGNSNTFSGATYLNEGTLVITGTNSIKADSQLYLRGGATLKVQSATNVAMPNLSLRVRDGKIDTNGVNLTVGYANDGGYFTKSLTKLGAGTLIFAGQPYFSGYGDRIDIQQGTIRFATVKGLDQAAVTVATGATFDDSWFDSVNSSDKRIGSLSGSGTYLARQSTYVRIGANGDSTTFSGVIAQAYQGTISSSPTTLYKEGRGTLTLSGANSYSGWTIIEAGTLIAQGAVAVNVPGPLGSSATEVYVGPVISGNADATLLMGAAATFARPITVHSIGTGIATIGSSAPGTAVFTGAVTLNRTAQLSASQVAEFQGPIGGAGGVVAVGPGTVRFTNANSYAGPTQVVKGVLELANAGRLGNTPYAEVGSGGTLQLNSLTGSFATPLRLQGGTTFGALNNAVGSNRVTGPVTLLTLSNIGVSGGDLTIDGTISGAGGLIKRGPGLLTLTANNSYSGGTFLFGGTTRFASLGNLGTGGFAFSGGTLQYAPGNTVDLSTRPVTFTGSAGIDTNGNNVTFANAVGGGGGGSLVKSGAGTLTLNAANNYSGGTTVNDGTLVGKAQASGSPFGSGPMTIGTATVRLEGSASGATTTVMGPFSVSGGATFSNLTGPGFTQANVQVNSLTRVGRGTLVLTAQSQFSFVNAPSTVSVNSGATNMIPAWAVYPNGGFLGYSGGQLTSFGTSLRLDDSNIPPNWTASWGESQTTMLTRDVAVYALSNNSPGTAAGNFTLTIGNGAGQAGLTFGGGTIATTTLAFGAAEATIYTAAAGGTIGAGTTVTGTGGLTKFGPGTLTVNGALNVSGPIIVNGGRLLINGSVGAGSSALTIGTGNKLGGTGTISAPVTIESGGILSPGNSPGTLTVTSPVALNPGSSFEVELGGTGAGQSDLLALGSTGTVDLGGAVLKASLVNGYVPQPGDSITIITGSGTNAVTGQFEGLALGEHVVISSGGGIDYFAEVIYGSSSVVLSNFNPVPEPASTLALAGIIVMTGYVRRRKLGSRRS